VLIFQIDSSYAEHWRSYKRKLQKQFSRGWFKPAMVDAFEKGTPNHILYEISIFLYLCF
jgi:hypothetical protein